MRKQMDERRKHFGGLDKLWHKVNELRAAGKAEEAERLEQKLKEMQKRARVGMGNKKGGEEPFKKPPKQ